MRFLIVAVALTHVSVKVASHQLEQQSEDIPDTTVNGPPVQDSLRGLAPSPQQLQPGSQYWTKAAQGMNFAPGQASGQPGQGFGPSPQQLQPGYQYSTNPAQGMNFAPGQASGQLGQGYGPSPQQLQPGYQYSTNAAQRMNFAPGQASGQPGQGYGPSPQQLQPGPQYSTNAAQGMNFAPGQASGQPRQGYGPAQQISAYPQPNAAANPGYTTGQTYGGSDPRAFNPSSHISGQMSPGVTYALPPYPPQQAPLVPQKIEEIECSNSFFGLFCKPINLIFHRNKKQ